MRIAERRRRRGYPAVLFEIGKAKYGKGTETISSSKEYLDFIPDQLSDLENVSFRAVMDEYVLYYRGKVIGGIYDDRFLIKPTRIALSVMPDARSELPYPGAQKLLLVKNVEVRAFLCRLLNAV